MSKADYERGFDDGFILRKEKDGKQKPLTEEEIIENCDTWVLDDIGGQEVIKIVRRTERAHGIGVEDEPDSSVT
jgi:hypothetical protein